MSNQQDESIDLNKLSQRELLILVYNKVVTLEKTSKEQTRKQNVTDIELAVIKTRIQVWSAIVGFASGLFSSVILFVITKAFGK